MSSISAQLASGPSMEFGSGLSPRAMAEVLVPSPCGYGEAVEPSWEGQRKEVASLGCGLGGDAGAPCLLPLFLPSCGGVSTPWAMSSHQVHWATTSRATQPRALGLTL